MIFLCIFTSSKDRFLDDLNPDYFLSYRRKNLCDRSGSAVEIKDHFVFGITDIFARLLIQYFRTGRICLEERKW